MMIGVATIPPLCDLEAEIERRGAGGEYASALLQTIGGAGRVWLYSNLLSVELSREITPVLLALTRLTETQKAQAALKVLGEK